MLMANRRRPLHETCASRELADPTCFAKVTDWPNGTLAMRAITFDNFGGPDVLRFTIQPDPRPRPTDLLIRVEAIGVNRADLNQRRGAYGRSDFGDSALMGLEIVGRVEEVGNLATGFVTGDRVMGIVGGGGYAELARIDYRMALIVPDQLDLVAAACIPEAFITAHEALIHLAGLKSGDTVLIHGASGGIGVAAVQIAHAIGATVYFGARLSSEAAVRALGGHVRLDSRDGDIVERVLAHTNGRGLDVILDIIGAPLLESNVTALADGGRLVQIGLLGGAIGAVLPIDRLLFRRLTLMGSVMKSRTLFEKAAMTSRFADRWLAHFANGRLKSVVAKTFPLAEAAAAHRMMEAGGYVGKLVLTL